MITGSIITKAGEIKQVSTRLNRTDKLGAIKVRWLIGRDNYRVVPGLYAVGNPTDKSDVLVTANYKLSFDLLRKNLDGIDAWILVLDTKGINVWCAAGKGTFGTQELVNRIWSTKLHKIISHRRLIVPQLGATGVSAHKVKELTSSDGPTSLCAAKNSSFNFSSFDDCLTVDKGFHVVFGPVRAEDIKEFIANGYRATTEMRKVKFTMADRVKLTGVDIVYARYKLLAAFALIFLLSGINASGFNFNQSIEKGFTGMVYLTLAYSTGIIITPLLLPYIPVRMFAFKGLISGLILSAVLLLLHQFGNNMFTVVSWVMLIAAVSSFMAMNFTGASTFTSLSGVKKEMRVFVPIQITMAIAGLILLVVGNLKT
jgi:hypothetical protein